MSFLMWFETNYDHKYKLKLLLSVSSEKTNNEPTFISVFFDSCPKELQLESNDPHSRRLHFFDLFHFYLHYLNSFCLLRTFFGQIGLWIFVFRDIHFNLYRNSLRCIHFNNQVSLAISSKEKLRKKKKVQTDNIILTKKTPIFYGTNTILFKIRFWIGLSFHRRFTGKFNNL